MESVLRNRNAIVLQAPPSGRPVREQRWHDERRARGSGLRESRSRWKAHGLDSQISGSRNVGNYNNSRSITQEEQRWLYKAAWEGIALVRGGSYLVTESTPELVTEALVASNAQFCDVHPSVNCTMKEGDRLLNEVNRYKMKKSSFRI